MSKVYLSSSYEDLKDHRDAVYRTLRQLRHDVVSMEDYVASGERPVDKCLADVAACDAYIGLFAWRYGYVPPGSAHSITELELREADGSGKPCLIFLLADDAPWPANRMDEDRQNILALRERLLARFTVQFFRGVDELARGVATATANLFDGDQDGEVSPEEIGLYRNCVGRFAAELGRDIRFYGTAAVVLVALALTAMGLALADTDSTRQWLVAGGGFLFASTSPFPVVTLRSTRKKKALLEGYADELAKERPARAAVRAVRRFVESQLSEPRLA